jgi:hypothetical protein
MAVNVSGYFRGLAEIGMTSLLKHRAAGFLGRLASGAVTSVVAGTTFELSFRTLLSLEIAMTGGDFGYLWQDKGAVGKSMARTAAFYALFNVTSVAFNVVWAKAAQIGNKFFNIGRAASFLKMATEIVVKGTILKLTNDHVMHHVFGTPKSEGSYLSYMAAYVLRVMEIRAGLAASGKLNRYFVDRTKTARDMNRGAIEDSDASIE